MSEGVPRAEPEVVVIDAGLVVEFAATRNLPLLNGVFEDIGIRRFVPAVVDKEVRRQDHRYPGTTKTWMACIVSGRVEVLEEVTATSGDPRVRDKVIDLRDLEVEEAFSTRRDLGEILVVAHALVLREDGAAVAVAIDDSDGARRAARVGLQNFDTIEVLSLAIDLGRITTRLELRKLYAALSKVSRLPLISQTGLVDKL